ncbi:minichromosome maintenance domain-containing protein 2 isoform X4 [Canis lupus baileyi]|uniref:minichromosome maintenance domain-containing protein 2 isoform X4 n=1 Tax=Canis lupus familiaris TaxID=9615 RepID=UPI000BAA2670|nr:minichromosome maintenance domain-containing protein 2 isoform X4 [Canis lupus familiaris]XP_025333675.1 minichromosome maintenance domain-containing protein 2 isoform X4 [Canis lupus dingo]XP_038297226.1 minichromosome maintenance domain-containing protein 2 isoform X4 [Canis lupus familiaris]XP_038435364.1 minichromosome maintenance domain-containing protein 2 isoform X4 [Canis lupus familiaris]|eukprot:XP_022268068.1 MCM domain-containing protein 2 isoform X4 [Canis lupus familiaris]
MSNLKMKEAALIYLDRSGGLQKFIDDCKSYNDSKQSYAVYRFNILINPSDITELDAELGNHILHQPLKAAQVFQSVCFTAVKTLSLIGQLQTETQINIVLKLTHLPQLRSYSLDLCEFPLDYASQRFYMMQGIVISMTTVTKYTQGARFLCSDEACPLSKGFQYIRVHVPGATESATVRNDFLCNLCSSSLQEDRKFRVLGDKQIVEIITAKALQAFKGYSNNQPFRFQSLTIFLRVPSGISNNFKDLLSLTSNSCWKFTAILANIFASQIVPPGTYNLLKLCLLMSLVQTCDRNKELKDCLDILIITSDTLLIDRLLNFSINLVPRGIRNPVSTEIFPTLTRNKYGTGAVSIQAGSALLAKGGICFIGDLASHKKDKLEQLQSVLESRSITVYIPGKKFGNDVNQHMTFPVQCSFWSFVDMDSSSRKNMQKTNTLIGQMDCSLIPANLLETFGLLINCNESSSFYPLLSTVQHTLKKAIDPEGQLYVASKNFTTEDFEKLLAFAKNLNVEFSLEAERMIHGYYLASRRIRTDSISGSKLSASALKYLVSLAEAHARLSLRNKVLKEDALIAALLFETSLTLKYGATVFCVAPSAVFPFELYNEEYLEQRDIYLTQCQQQLQQFIATYGPGTAIFTSDE